MIRCKQSGMLPLHLAAVSSASPWLVESLILEYPEALQIAVNNMTPRDLVTAALPMESIKLICRPRLHCSTMYPTQLAEKDQAGIKKNAESLQLVPTDAAKMLKMFESFCNNLLELNVKVDAVQKRLQEFSTKLSDLDSLSISLPLVCESFSCCSNPLTTQVFVEPSLTKARKTS